MPTAKVINRWQDYDPRLRVVEYSMPFEKVETKRKNVYIIEQILQAIQSGEYQTGDKLPTERVLAEETGVSRSSIREAFAVLRQAGVIESKTGAGTYVTKSSFLNDKFQVLRNVDSEYSLFEVLKARREIEPIILKNALIEFNKRKKESIEKVINKMEKAYQDEQINTYLSIHWDFHAAIAECSGNQVFMKISDFLLRTMKQGVWRKFLEKYHSSIDKIESSFHDHRQIFLAMKSENEEEALRRLREHYDNLEKRLNI